VKKSLCLVAALVVLMAACGGDGGAETTTTTDNQSESTQPEAGQTAPATTENSNEEAEAESAPAGEEGTGTAIVGDQTWEFELLENDGRSFCMVEPGVLVSLFGTDQDGNEVALTINAGPSGGPAEVTFGDPTLNGERWIADAGVYDQLSGIEGMPEGVGATAQVEGNTIRGSGVFYEDRRLNEVRPTGDAYDAGVLEGSFEATCPPSE
jgi:hypothetical protein